MFGLRKVVVLAVLRVVLGCFLHQVSHRTRGALAPPIVGRVNFFGMTQRELGKTSRRAAVGIPGMP